MKMSVYVIAHKCGLPSAVKIRILRYVKQLWIIKPKALVDKHNQYICDCILLKALLITEMNDHR